MNKWGSKGVKGIKLGYKGQFLSFEMNTPGTRGFFSRLGAFEKTFRAGHFLRLNRNRKRRMKSLWHPGYEMNRLNKNNLSFRLVRCWNYWVNSNKYINQTRYVLFTFVTDLVWSDLWSQIANALDWYLFESCLCEGLLDLSPFKV